MRPRDLRREIRALGLLAQGDRTIASVAQEIGVDERTLRRWVKRLRNDPPDLMSTYAAVRAEYEELKSERNRAAVMVMLLKAAIAASRRVG